MLIFELVDILARPLALKMLPLWGVFWIVSHIEDIEILLLGIWDMIKCRQNVFKENVIISLFDMDIVF